MKKMVTIIISFTIAVFLCACGTTVEATNESSKISEPFELRDGIHFGDTIDEVKAKVDGLTYVEEYESHEKDIQTKEIEQKTVLEYSGTISGSECKIRFYFNENGALVDLDYRFSCYSDVAEACDLYNLIRDTCTKKYGEPLKLEEGHVFAITGKALYHAYNDYSQNSSVAGYSEWVVNGENEENVKIDEAIYYQTGKSTLLGVTDYYTFYYVDVSYHYYTQEELDAVLMKKNAEGIDKATEEMKKQAEADATF